MVIKRVPEPQGRKGGLGFFGKALFFVAVIALIIKAIDYLPTTTSAKRICDGLKAGEAQRIIASWEQAGVIVGHRAGVVEVSEQRWAQIKNDAKVSLGIAEFCDDNPNSVGVLIVRGDMNNTNLGSVVNGNWSN